MCANSYLVLLIFFLFRLSLCHSDEFSIISSVLTIKSQYKQKLQKADWSQIFQITLYLGLYLYLVDKKLFSSYLYLSCDKQGLSLACQGGVKALCCKG